MLGLLQNLIQIDGEPMELPRLVAAAFIPQHLPDRVFFLTSDLPGVRRLRQFTNFYMHDSELTIVPDEEWGLEIGWMPWACIPIPLCALVRIRQSGNYSGSLGIVLAASRDNSENLIVAVVPKIPYHSSSTPLRERDGDISSLQPGPSRKRQKVEPRARLFDLDYHLKYTGSKSAVITHRAASEGVLSTGVVPDISLYNFFATPSGIEPSRFPPKEVSMANKHGQPITATLHLDCRKLVWAGNPTLPLYEFGGEFYWKGLLLMPIYHHASVDRAVVSYSPEELVPFIEADVFCSIFGPILSQLYWKEGDKIIEASYYESGDAVHEAVVFKVDEVVMPHGIAWATPIQLLRRDGLQQAHTWLADMDFSDDINVERQHVLSQDLRRKIRGGRQECSLATHRLHLAVGDHVMVLAGKDQGACGHVIISEASQLSVLPIGSTTPVSLPLLFNLDFSS